MAPPTRSLTGSISSELHCKATKTRDHQLHKQHMTPSSRKLKALNSSGDNSSYQDYSKAPRGTEAKPGKSTNYAGERSSDDDRSADSDDDYGGCEEPRYRTTKT